MVEAEARKAPSKSSDLRAIHDRVINFNDREDLEKARVVSCRSCPWTGLSALGSGARSSRAQPRAQEPLHSPSRLSPSLRTMSTLLECLRLKQSAVSSTELPARSRDL